MNLQSTLRLVCLDWSLSLYVVVLVYLLMAVRVCSVNIDVRFFVHRLENVVIIMIPLHYAGTADHHTHIHTIRSYIEYS